jgi:transposase
MFDSPLDHKPSSDRVDLRGRAPQRPRRNWTKEAKGSLVAAMLSPGANVSEIARKHEISRQHLYLWRRAALTGKLPLPAPCQDHASLDVAKPLRRIKPDLPAPTVEIEVSGIVVRVYPDADLELLANIMQVLKTST